MPVSSPFRLIQGAFMLTLMDVVAVPLAVLSLLTPFRWPRVVSAFRRYDKDQPW